MRNRRNQLEYARFRTERKKRTAAGYSAKDKDLKSSTADVYLGCRLSAINKTWKKILTAEVKNPSCVRSCCKQRNSFINYSNPNFSWFKVIFFITDTTMDSKSADLTATLPFTLIVSIHVFLNMYLRKTIDI